MREGVYKLPVADEYGFRLTLCVCYHMEKWASLCHGIPSNMIRSPEFNSIISGLADVGPAKHPRCSNSLTNPTLPLQ